MNREILFKAKRVDNGKWVEGYVINKNYIATGEIDIELDKDYWEHSYGYSPSSEDFHLTNIVEIYPKTVCQFSSLTDKNGKKIFEGDILFCKGQTAPVIFDDGAFWIGGTILHHVIILHKVEIIGNIHDDKEDE